MFSYLAKFSRYGQLEESLARMRSSETRLRRAHRLKLEEVEDQLARTTLLVHSLSELCLKKGLITSAELAAEISATGNEDGAGNRDTAAPA
jgi:hypothetical protein